MPYDASGVYSLPAALPIVANSPIISSQPNAGFSDIAAALSLAFLRDGRASMTGNLSMNGNRIIGLPSPSAGTDAMSRDAGDARYLQQAGADVRYVQLTGSRATGTITSSAASGVQASFGIETGTSLRWLFGKDAGAESGSNAGSGFTVARYSDAGGFLGSPLSINRANGTITLETTPFVGGNQIWHAGTFTPAAKADLASPNFSGTPAVAGNAIYHAGNFNPANYATLASPALTGTPTIGGNAIWHAGNLANATTSTAGLMSAADKTKLNGLERFESAQQTITLGGSYTIAHGLSARPEWIAIEYECTTAEHNYSVGDRVPAPVFDVPTTGVITGFSIVPDATNLNVRMAPVNAPFILNKTTGAVAQITTTSWRFRVKART